MKKQKKSTSSSQPILPTALIERTVASLSQFSNSVSKTSDIETIVHPQNLS
jgi:hypothetical protein